MARRAIPQAARRALARARGCPPGGVCTATCAYCPATGRIRWFTRRNGQPSGWVHFSGLEIDHITPVSGGGSNDPSNLTLACMRCNRSKGAQPLVAP